MEMFNFDESFIGGGPLHSGIDSGMVSTDMRMCNVVSTPKGVRRATNAEFDACYADLERYSSVYNVRLRQE